MQNSNRAPDERANSKYVPALKDATPAGVAYVEVEVMRDLPVAPQTVLMPKASYTDRARGFSLATAPLAGVAGLVAGLIGIIGWKIPIASLVTLLLALGGFTVVWLAAYLAHVMVSPDGALTIHVVMTWRLLFMEARERRKRYRDASRGDTHR